MSQSIDPKLKTTGFGSRRWALATDVYRLTIIQTTRTDERSAIVTWSSDCDELALSARRRNRMPRRCEDRAEAGLEQRPISSQEGVEDHDLELVR
jgi:hypothetical protein